MSAPSFKMGAFLGDKRELAKLRCWKWNSPGGLAIHEAAIVTILRRVMDIDPPSPAVVRDKPKN